MRHFFGKEHKERKSMRLVKKLQQEEDENWHAEQQRRLEQEEKDAAFALELQEQTASVEHSTNNDDVYTTASPPASPTISPVVPTLSPLSSSPPPIPAKPTAYYSGKLPPQNYIHETLISFFVYFIRLFVFIFGKQWQHRSATSTATVNSIIIQRHLFILINLTAHYSCPTLSKWPATTTPTRTNHIATITIQLFTTQFIYDT
jgi:hypothetical protein